MSWRGFVRGLLVGMFLVGALSTGASCYRAEVDLTPLLVDKSPSGGGVLASGAAGEAGDTSTGGAASGAGGVAGAPACDMTPDDAVQAECRLRLPPRAMCDAQDSPGWPGCYDGGCSVCTEVLADYPYYLARHPCCASNQTCSVHRPVKCSPLCPPPTELDQLQPCFELEL